MKNGFTPAPNKQKPCFLRFCRPACWVPGFTLMEFLVYIAVLSIITLTVSSFFLGTTRINAKNKAMREVTANTKRAMEIMTGEIKEAKAVYTPTTATGQLSLETAKYLPNNETESYIDFYLCDDRLCLKKEGQLPVALTSERVKITEISFFKIATSSPSVQIHLKVDYKTGVLKPEFQASFQTTSTASVRAY